MTVELVNGGECGRLRLFCGLPIVEGYVVMYVSGEAEIEMG